MKRLFIPLLGYLAFIPLMGYCGDQVALDAGIGVFNSGKKSLSETKMMSLGYQVELSGPLKERTTLGGWIDDAGNGRKNSSFFSEQIGYEVNNNGWVGGIFTGPTYLGTTDRYLGGHLQFLDDVRLGIQDREGHYFGIAYRHESDAGLKMPNIGRDFICVEVRF